MSFETYEESIRSGSPIELYEIQIGTTFYRYTSHPEIYTYNLNDYEPIVINRSGISNTDNISKSDLDIKVGRDSSLARFITTYNPSVVILLTVYRLHEDDPAQQAIVAWKGRIIDFSWKQNELELRAESILTSIARVGLTRTFSEGCPYAVFDSQCRALSGPYQENVTILSVNGRDVTVNTVGGQADNYFRGGFIEVNFGQGLIERRMIITQVGTVLTLGYALSTLGNIDAAIIYPGCDKTVIHCENKFNNILNYGGFPHTPSLNPFTTTIY